MAISYKRWISSEIEHYDLSGYAAQAVESRLRNDETARALWDAARQTDLEQSERRSDDLEEDDLARTLRETRRQCDSALSSYVETLIEEECSSVEMYDFTVDLRRATRLDPCPSCECRSEGFYLGEMGHMFDGDTAWLCHNCGAEITETYKTGELAVLSEGDRDE